MDRRTFLGVLPLLPAATRTYVDLGPAWRRHESGRCVPMYCPDTMYRFTRGRQDLWVTPTSRQHLERVLDIWGREWDAWSLYSSSGRGRTPEAYVLVCRG